MTSLSTVMVPRVRWKKAVSSSCLSMAVTGSSVSSSLLSRTLLLVLAAWCRELQYSCSISPVWSCSTSICSWGRVRLLWPGVGRGHAHLLAAAQPRHVRVEEDERLEAGELRPVQPQPGHSVQGVGEELHLGEGH